MREKVLSWGRFPHHPQEATPCHWREELPFLVQDMARHHGTFLPFGDGRSYGDSCMAASGHVLQLRPLDRFIAADWREGWIRAEAGVTLGEILALAVPRGWFLPVVPGTRFVTLGGAIANDVHGKNHHRRGTFGRHVRRLRLVRSDRGVVVCSPSENAHLHAATVAGLGLTGIIEWAEVQLMPVRSGAMDVRSIPFGTLDEFFALSAELDAPHEYAVAWIDCLARGRALGRGVYFLAGHAPEGEREFVATEGQTVPFTLPLALPGRLSIAVFNRFYHWSHRRRDTRSRVQASRFFFPLDRLRNWNRLYGPRGFVQYQCVIPEPSPDVAIREILRTTAEAGAGSFLAVLKRFGDMPSPGLLSFPTPGVTLALDFANDHRTVGLVARLDAIVRQAGGRIYPAKDALSDGADFRAAYPRWEQLERLRDPAIVSRFWQRVTGA